jgi:hypothetical protein
VGARNRCTEAGGTRFFVCEPFGSAFLAECDPPATVSRAVFRYGAHTGDSSGWRLAMIGYVVRDGRLLSLQAAEWLMLLIGGTLAGAPLLLF